MKISNRVRRNISFTLLLVGIACMIARGWQLAMDPASGRAWFNLFSMTVITYICFSRFRELSRRVKAGIVFGSR